MAPAPKSALDEIANPWLPHTPQVLAQAVRELHEKIKQLEREADQEMCGHQLLGYGTVDGQRPTFICLKARLHEMPHSDLADPETNWLTNGSWLTELTQASRSAAEQEFIDSDGEVRAAEAKVSFTEGERDAEQDRAKLAEELLAEIKAALPEHRRNQYGPAAIRGMVESHDRRRDELEAAEAKVSRVEALLFSINECMSTTTAYGSKVIAEKIRKALDGDHPPVSPIIEPSEQEPVDSDRPHRGQW